MRGWIALAAVFLLDADINSEQNETLYLQLIVNEMRTNEYVFVRINGEDLWIQGDVLRTVLPSLPIPEGDWVSLQSLDADGTYRSESQQLALNVATDYLPMTRLGTSRTTQPLTYGRSLIFNYDAFVQQNRARQMGQESMFAGIQGGVEAVAGPFSFRHQQFYRNQRLDNQSASVRLDTSIWYQDYNNLYTVIAGDFISSASASARGYRMGGLYVGRDYSLDPELITFPVPDFFGSAALPSTTELFIDGVLSSQGEVPAGPFSFDVRPYLSGAGNAQLVTTDIFGRVVTEERSFYISEQLLAPGMDDFAISTGYLRRGYSQRSADYDSSLSAVGFYRRGLTLYTTGGINAEVNDEVRVVGGDITQKLGRLGVLHSGYRFSNTDASQSGNEYSVSYRYDDRRWTMNARYLRRSDSFMDVGDTFSVFASPRETMQVLTSFRFPEYGSLSLGWFRLNYSQTNLIGEQQPRNELVTLSFSPRARRGLSLFFNANKELEQGTYSVSANLSFSLSARRYASVSATSDSVNNAYGRVQLASSSPTQYGSSWTISQTINQQQDMTQGLFNYNHSLAEGYVGVFGPSSDLSAYGGLRGSVIAAGRQFFFSSPVHQAFAVVDTDGEGDIPVYVSNRYVGTTNSRGYMVANNLIANVDNLIHIDPLGLGIDIAPTNYEARVRPAGRVGIPVSFTMQRRDTELVRIEYSQGEPAPYGTVIRAPAGEIIVGWDGEIELAREARLGGWWLELPDGRLCQLRAGNMHIRQCRIEGE